jgi:hypothetical protein
MCYVWGPEEMRSWFWWGNVREGHHLQNLGIDGRIIIKWIINRWYGGHGMD